MGWQDDVRDILEKADWPPRPSVVSKSPWPKVILLAAIGWMVAELLSRAEESFRARAERTEIYR